uniref:Uncharacterized protein n=1 Tax=Eutreptiella gymnastica TaxID=73025 RepID=A0A7S1I0X3_9EUGL|mmetsp:Transcript_119735/g.208469  ORF Transcript_119735/g.208469 Transcript_119735/m.208469 type:complete len:105 (+) Transcript_119735:45-359(+)
MPGLWPTTELHPQFLKESGTKTIPQPLCLQNTPTNFEPSYRPRPYPNLHTSNLSSTMSLFLGWNNIAIPSHVPTLQAMFDGKHQRSSSKECFAGYSFHHMDSLA